MIHCSQCRWLLPYWRLAAPRNRARPLPGITNGKGCPSCGGRTDRQRTPVLVRPLRALTFQRCSYRECRMCAWRGVAFHPKAVVSAQRAAG